MAAAWIFFSMGIMTTKRFLLCPLCSKDCCIIGEKFSYGFYGYNIQGDPTSSSPASEAQLG